MQVPGLADGDARPVLRDHLHPRGGVHLDIIMYISISSCKISSVIDLHQCIRYEDDVHPIEHAGQDSVPEPDIPLEVEHADHDLALGVVAGEGERPGVGEHGRPADADPQHTAVLLGRVLYIGGGVVCQPGGRVPVLGRPGQMLSDEPVQLGPALKKIQVHNIVSLFHTSP